MTMFRIYKPFSTFSQFNFYVAVLVNFGKCLFVKGNKRLKINADVVHFCKLAGLQATQRRLGVSNKFGFD